MNMNNLQRSFERFNTLANVLRGLRGIGESTISIDLTLWELEDIAELLYEKISSVNPLPKTGHWIWCVGSHKCSNCEEYTCFSHKELLKYCPNCGAKMVEPQESEE